MRRSFLRVPNKNINYKIKKSILFVIFSFVFAFIGGNSVSALDIRQQSLEITGKSDTTVVHDAGIGNLRITPNIEFNRLNDFISYKLVIKNNDGKKYQIVGITDDNVNEAIALSYSYPKEMDTNNKEIDFTVKYVNITNSPLKTINVTIKVIDEDDASSDVPIIVPGTGTNTSLDTVSAATIQTAVIYIIFAASCCAIYIMVRRRKTKEDKKASLKIPKIMLALALLVGFLPVVVVAADFENIYFTINLTEVKLNGPYMVTFDTGEGGTPVPSQIVNKGDKIIEPADPPQRKGYDFKGWVDENGNPYDFDTPVENNITLKAKWEKKEYTVTFDSNGGSAVQEQKVKYQDTATEPTPDPTRGGYDFVQWVDEEGEEYVFDTPVEDNITLTAQWIKLYTVTFNSDGGSSVQEETVRDGGTINRPINPEKTGHNFVKWVDEDDNEYVFGTPVTSDFELTAVWEKKEYTVTFDPDGGSAVQEQKVKYKEFATKPDDPEKNGHDFVKWQLNGTDYDFDDTPVEDNITLKAVWKTIDYTITYHLGDGAVDPGNPKTYTIESDVILLDPPTREHYKFAGWTGTDLTEPTEDVVIRQGSTGDREYTATWTPSPYTIEYDLKGGTVTTANPTEYNIESENITLNNPEKEGYTFTGWTGTGLADKTMEVVISKGSTGNRKYTATWTPTNYTITYHLGDGAVDPGNPGTYNIEDSDITLSGPTREGYDFDGWTGTDVAEVTKDVKIPQGSMGNREYTAHWTKLHTVSFNADSGAPTPDSQKVRDGGHATAPENNPTRNGYKFMGWQLNGVDYDFESQEVTADIELKANWEIIEYTIHYDLFGGEVSGNPDTYTVEDTFTLNNPTLADHRFKGWSGSDGHNPQKTVTIEKGTTGNLHFIAHWSELVTVEYDTNGGEDVDPFGEELEAGSPIGPLPTTTKNGYNFLGWYVEGDPTETVINENYIVNENITIIAKWEIINYTITYHLGDGAVDPGNPGTYNVEDSDITLSEPTREGYVFKGWTGTDITEATKDVVIRQGSTGDREYTATWNELFTVTYDVNEGEPVTPVSFQKENGEQIGTLATTTREHYIFEGWYIGDTKVEENYEVTANITIKATWTPSPYTIEYDLKGGTVTTANPTEYNIESENITLNNPEKEGYTFTGWTGTGLADKTMEVVISKGSTGNRKYTATWTPTNYTITYHLGDGAVDPGNPGTYNIESNYIILHHPTREHYKFIGWTGTDLAELTEDVVIRQGSIGDREYTANWEGNEYTLIFDSDGGTPVSSQVITYPDPTSKPADPTKDGFTFLYWMDEDGNEFTFGNALTKEETKLKAKWQANEAKIVLTIGSNRSNSLSKKIKGIANQETVNDPYNYDDYSVKGIVTATDEEYEAIKDNLTNDNIISDGSSNAPIYMWWDESTGSLKVYTEAKKIVLSGSMEAMLAKLYALEDLSGLADWDVSGVTDMNRAFQNCPLLDDEKIEPLRNWDVSNVTSLMFAFGGGNNADQAPKIKTFDAIKDWNVGKVENFESMVKFNPVIENLDSFKNWNMTSATSIKNMFTGTTALTDASAIKDWNVINVTASGFNNVFSGSPIRFQGNTDVLPKFAKRPGKWDTDATTVNGKYIPNS